MQVDLGERCERATERAAGDALLFDLNGFKRYNDTFGHPAGDELLVRLGGALREAVGDDGDRLPDRRRRVLRAADLRRGTRFDAVAARAAEALTAQRPGLRRQRRLGRGDDPGRGRRSPPTALQLADVRMYAQKESRRARPRPSRDRPARAGADRALGTAKLSSSASGPRVTSARLLRVLGARDQHRRLVEGAHQHVGQRLAPAAARSPPPRPPPAGSLRSGRGRGGADLAPAVPAEHRGASSRAICCSSGSAHSSRNVSTPARIASSGAVQRRSRGRPRGDPLGRARPRSARRPPRSSSRLPSKWW